MEIVIDEVTLENIRGFVLQDMGFEANATLRGQDKLDAYTYIAKDIPTWSEEDLVLYISNMDMEIDDFK